MNTDADTNLELLERKRDLVMHRLVPVLDALDRKRHAVTDAVHDLVPRRAELSRVPGRDRAVFLVIGAAAGALTFVVAAWVDHLRHERNRPLRKLSRALERASKPRKPSLFGRLARAVGSLAVSAASGFVRERLMGWIEERAAARPEPEAADVLDVPPAPARSPLAPPPLPTVVASAPAVVVPAPVSPHTTTSPGFPMPPPPIRSE